eukprot:30952-Pelagococcus_subviridis.AAC.13
MFRSAVCRNDTAIFLCAMSDVPGCVALFCSRNFITSAATSLCASSASSHPVFTTRDNSWICAVTTNPSSALLRERVVIGQEFRERRRREQLRVRARRRRVLRVRALGRVVRVVQHVAQRLELGHGLHDDGDGRPPRRAAAGRRRERGSPSSPSPSPSPSPPRAVRPENEARIARGGRSDREAKDRGGEREIPTSAIRFAAIDRFASQVTSAPADDLTARAAPPLAIGPPPRVRTDRRCAELLLRAIPCGAAALWAMPRARGDARAITRIATELPTADRTTGSASGSTARRFRPPDGAAREGCRRCRALGWCCRGTPRRRSSRCSPRSSRSTSSRTRR